RAAAPFGRNMSPPSVGVTLRTPRQMGLSFPVQQSRSSLRSRREPSIRSIVARGTLPSGAAEPQLPSEAARVPPPIVLNLLTYSAFNGASPPGAAEPWLPSVAVCAACSVAGGALSPGAAEPRLPSVAVGAPRPIHCRKGDSRFR
ncbi:hypothetical protein M9458_008912, partial [Cirrhinus mrigala]